MVQSCVVVGCTNRWKKDSRTSWHRFPSEKDSERHKIWLNSVGRKNWQPKSADRVCGRHFISGCASSDPLNPDYAPSIAMGYNSQKFKTPELTKARHCRSEERSRRKSEHEADENARTHAASALVDLSTLYANTFDRMADTEDSPPKDHVHDKCREEIAKMALERKGLMSEIARLQVENEGLRKEVNESKFGLNQLQKGNTSQKVTFYTGLPNLLTLIWVINYVKDTMPTFKSVSVENTVVLTLMKLRLNLQNFDLAARFRVSTTTVSDIINKCLPVMADKLKFLVRWPDRENVIRTLPKVFRKAYPNARCIIDCTEVFVERPGNLTARAATWSNYKHTNTLKYLVAITPCGSVSFVSRAYGGRTSDKVVTQRSGFLDLLEFNDLVLADRGFLIQEEITSRNCYLSMPAFTKGQTQLTQKQVECSRQLARVRIHVERAIERVKNFKVLNTSMSLNLVPHADNILTLCSAIANLQPKLVK